MYRNELVLTASITLCPLWGRASCGTRLDSCNPKPAPGHALQKASTATEHLCEERWAARSKGCLICSFSSMYSFHGRLFLGAIYRFLFCLSSPWNPVMYLNTSRPRGLTRDILTTWYVALLHSEFSERPKDAART